MICENTLIIADIWVDFISIIVLTNLGLSNIHSPVSTQQERLNKGILFDRFPLTNKYHTHIILHLDL